MIQRTRTQQESREAVAARMVRCFHIDQLKRDGLNAPQIAEQLEVSRRTVHREVQLMKMIRREERRLDLPPMRARDHRELLTSFRKILEEQSNMPHAKIDVVIAEIASVLNG